MSKNMSPVVWQRYREVVTEPRVKSVDSAAWLLAWSALHRAGRGTAPPPSRQTKLKLLLGGSYNQKQL